jgi:transcription elongation factor Elf1
MIEGDISCPQCNHLNIVSESENNFSGQGTDTCEDCGCFYAYEFEIVLNFEKVAVLKRGTKLDDAE